MKFVKEMKQQQNGDHFVLRIVQQPYHAKAIGFKQHYGNYMYVCKQLRWRRMKHLPNDN